MAKNKFSSVDEYICAAPKAVQPILKSIKREIKTRLPKATATISYNIPAFKDGKVFVYFAAFKNHIGIYPPVKNRQLKLKFKKYMNEKGNLAIPLEEEISMQLIGDLAVALWNQRV